MTDSNMYYCKSCDKIKHELEFYPTHRKKLKSGLYFNCGSCLSKYTSQYHKRKSEENLGIFRICSVEYTMNNDAKRMVQLEAIRCLYRVWCKTGIMPKHEPEQLNYKNKRGIGHGKIRTGM